VRLHLGFKTPEELGADRGQFHSKVVLVELDATERCIIIGSHNWTGNALLGYNLEAGMILRCQEQDSIVGEVREHIEACAQRSEPFERKRLRFYETIQRDLHHGIGPGNQESEDFPGFEEVEAVVIHAEDGTPDGLPQPVQLFVPVRDRFTQQLFTQAARVLLYLYPPGTLIGKTPVGASPVEFEGEVTMTNLVPDAPVTARSATCRLDDLAAPRIDLLPGNTVPSPSGELSQVVIRFDAKGASDLPVFHATEQHPKMRLGVSYHAVDRDENDESVRRSRRDGDDDAPCLTEEPCPEYQAPHQLTVRSTLKVPSQDLYGSDIRQHLTYVLMGSDFFDELTVPELDLEPPPPKSVLNRYVYRVNYRLSRDTVARIERQPKLFPTV